MELKTMNANQDHQILYAAFENDIQIPILDITHPLFNASIDEQAYHLSCLKSARSIKSLKKMPGLIRNIFVKMSNVDNSHLSGMRTLLYKLGPDLSRGIKLGFRDKWAVKQTSFMGLRIRLRDLCRRQSKILQPQLKLFPERNLCFFNIAGGAATDSINTLILIQESDPELLKGRKIEINILDIDTYGPNFAKRCIDVLKQPGERFHGLNITLNIIHYDWSQPEALRKMSLERSDWIQLCSSEGGFEFRNYRKFKLLLYQLPGGRPGHGLLNFRSGACKSGIPGIYRVYWRENPISWAGGVAANFSPNLVGFGRIS